MNIRDFEYLIAIDELGNFSNAAEKCFISQPALSQQVKKVEGYLGFDIFERYKKKIITTEKGKEVIKHAKSILHSYELIKTIKQSEKSIKIGLIPTICPYLLPLIVSKLKAELPQVKFYFLELKTSDLMQKLKTGEIDIGVIAFFNNLLDDQLNYLKLYDEEFLLTLPNDSDLTVKDFPQIVEDKKLILLEEGNCMSDNIKEICSVYKQNSFSDFFSTNIETVKNMVRMNNGIALLPKLACLNEKDLKTLAFKQKKSREIGIMSRKNFTESEVVKTIKSIISLSVQEKL